MAGDSDISVNLYLLFNSSIGKFACIEFSIQKAGRVLTFIPMAKMTYSLRQMTDMTGLTEFTLRGWELRYDAFNPARNETARRQYSSSDLQKAILLRELLRRDRKIGEIAALSISESSILYSRTNTMAMSRARDAWVYKSFSFSCFYL